MTTEGIDPASFRDPSGFVFHRDGVIFRQVNRGYREHYDQLIDSGLYLELVESNLLIDHEEVDERPVVAETAYRVLRPRPVGFISYPFEWSFSQLRDAALATLKTQKLALERGMILKDASAYNIQFVGGRPMLIDTLSFEKYTQGEPWIAYGQFCRHFLAPLALMSHVDVRLGTLLRDYIDGIPLDLASRLLPGRTRFRLGLMVHIHLHARSVRRHAGSSASKPRRSLKRRELLGLIDNLEGGVRRLQWAPEGTEWADYYDDTSYSDADQEGKRQIVEGYLDKVGPATVLDLGANTGRFSRLAASKGISTVACDVDPAAVEKCYLRCRRTGETNLLPLLIDLVNPSPAVGWANRERTSFSERARGDLVFALALVHHLAISNNLPLRRIASYLRSLSDQLVIEFVPKSDPQVKRLLSSRDDIFPDYTQEGFERAFGEVYSIESKAIVGATERVLYLLRSLSGPS
jgi:ribosomal protein L11 methylase PrmA